MQRKGLGVDELNAHLTLIAPHDPATASEQEGEFVRNILPVCHRELRAAGGYIPNDAAQRSRLAITIDLSEIMYFVTGAFAQVTKRIAKLKERHRLLRRWLRRVENGAEA
jgi:hypothetical protein